MSKHYSKGCGITVAVRDGKVETAINIFKKKVKNFKILLEYRDRMEYQKPSDKKRRERALSKRRSKKYQNNFSK